MRRILSSRSVVCPLLIGLAILLSCALRNLVGGDKKPALDLQEFDRIYSCYASSEVTSLADMAELYAVEWEQFLPLTLPYDDLFLQKPPVEVQLFNPQNFPAPFVKGLVGVEANGRVTYPVTVVMNSARRELSYYNVRKERIAVATLPDWFEPDESLEFYFGSIWAEETWTEMADRMQFYFELIEEDELVDYVILLCLKEKDRKDKDPDLGGIIMMAYEGPPVSNIQFTSIEKLSNGVEVTIAYPWDGETYPTNCFTNALDIFSCTNLLTANWALRVTTNANPSTNWIEWLDTSATGVTVRFYAAANAGPTADTDADGDGLPWGREHYVYKTDPADLDSDDDGLVDGYSGVVSTNDYPGGVSTSGSSYVEGELSWQTDALLPDTDGDGVDDGTEVANGTDPLDPNDPPNVLGTVSYDGKQAGTIYVIAVTSSNSWATNCSDALTVPGDYQISSLTGTNYYLKAFRDSDGDGSNDIHEAWGVYTNNPVLITNQVTNINVTLTDPDSDSDSLPDWWEVQYFGSVTNWGATNDPDSDSYSNLQEYHCETVPTNSASHPLTISGTIFYSGNATGTIYVVASTATVDWVGYSFTNITSPGSYTIDLLKPGDDYYVRAYRDDNGSASYTDGEPSGLYSSSPMTLSTDATGINITLSDPDTDGDGMPDWWENRHGFDADSTGWPTPWAWWKLDETSGATASDATGYGNSGDLKNTASGVWMPGIIGNGLLLDGEDDYVQLYDDEALQPGALTLSLWIRPGRDYTNGSAVFFSKKDPSATKGYRLSYESGYLSLWLAANGAKEVKYAVTLNEGQWYHVVGTYGGTYQRLYTNGVCVAQEQWDHGTSSGDILNSTTDPRLGTRTTAAPSAHFEGILDNVQLYGSELNSNQVYALYEVGADPDGDALSNWGECRADTDPSDGDDPPSVSGTVSYSGAQSGLIWVVAVSTSNSWATTCSGTAFSPTDYTVPNVSSGSHYVKAFVDSDEDGAFDSWEAHGAYTNNAVEITNKLTGISITLADPDDDSDSMSDWWEVLQFGDLSHTGSADGDGDGLTDLQEWNSGTWTDPNNADTDGDGVLDDDDADPDSSTDSEPDSLPDDWETHWFGDLDETGIGDYDSDGATNLEEYNLGTDPTTGNADDSGNSTELSVIRPVDDE